jgi:hypothetical protein
MLLPKNTNPYFSIYYLGAIVLRELASINEKSVDFLRLYHQVSSHNKVSVQSFTLTLDWLYLLGSIELNEKGGIVKCF